MISKFHRSFTIYSALLFVIVPAFSTPVLSAEGDEVSELERELRKSGDTKLTYSPDRKHLVEWRKFRSRTLKIWSVRDKRLVREFRVPGRPLAVAFRPDGLELIAADGEGNLEYLSTIRALNLQTGAKRTIGSCMGSIPSLCFSPDGSRIAAVANFNSIGAMVHRKDHPEKAWCGGQIRIWQMSDGKELLKVDLALPGLKDIQKKLTSAPVQADTGNALVAAYNTAVTKTVPVRLNFSSDGRQLIAVTVTGSVNVLDSRTGKNTQQAQHNAKPRYKLVPPQFGDGLVIGRYQYTHVDEEGKRRLTLDTYRPANVDSGVRLPMLVMYFGGGWINGRPGHFTPLAQAIARRGYVTVVPNYRLSGEASFPAAVHECKAAVRWTRKSAKLLKGDPDRIAVTGGSAGGHLAGFVAATNGLKEFEGMGDHRDVSSDIQAVIVMCGPMNFLNQTMKENIKRSQEKGQVHAVIRFLGASSAENRELYVKASPITHISQSMPPALFIDGELDSPRKRYIGTWKKMDELGIAHEFVLMKNGPHPFWNYEQWFEETVDSFDAFLSKQFRNADSARQ
ncbi:MAG: alpha/beta hydrolase fold domain-containing protein [Fuerstiella sp.]|nr:alpha/beta hydrolase fold domain-containing protein [Fuerstiella sp.]